MITASEPLLEVIVVSYGHPDMVSRCMRSLYSFPPSHGAMRVHLVDNRSSEDVVGPILRKFPQVSAVRMGYNAGFAVANNRALRLVKSRYVLVLNPDTEIGPGVLDYLLTVIDSDPEIGVLGCRLVTANGSFDHAAKRRIPTVASAAKYFIPARLGAGRQSQYLAPEIAEDGRGEVDAVNGAFMLVRTTALTDVGLLDEAYWMYGEDLDWCVRFRSSGWRVYYDGSVTVKHLKGGTSGGSRKFRLNWQFHRSMLVFYRKHLAGENRLLDLAVPGLILARFGLTSSIGASRAAVTWAWAVLGHRTEARA